MENILLIVLIALVLILIWAFFRKNKRPEDQGGLNLILQQMNEITKTVDSKLGDLTKTVDFKIGETNKQVNDTLRFHSSESSRLIKEITEELVGVKEGQKQVVGFTEQLQGLQDMLKNPKQRGVLGEYYLETLLKNVLPPGSYKMQYKVGQDDGKDLIVDAAVFVKEKIVPIDSKFSLENYNRLVEERDPIEKEKLEKAFVSDLKYRIQETSKYIRPNDGTTDFAFMFIPHEAIYYDLLVNKVGSLVGEQESLIQRAAGKYKVIIVSPTSFLAYLQTVLQGLRALEIEDKAKDIVKRVNDLGKHLKVYESLFLKLGNSLKTTVSHYNSSSKELGKIDKDVLRITGESPGIVPETLEKPVSEDDL